MNEKYLKELLLLAEGLMKRGIQFEFRLLNGGGQISTKTWDAVCHDFSYGHGSGELEIMGTLVNNTNDSVEGFLTAEELLKRVDTEVMSYADDERNS